MFSEDKGINMYNGNMIEFLYSKNAIYQWKRLDIPKTEMSCWHDYKIDLEVDNVLSLMTDEFDLTKNLCLCNNLNYHYHFTDGAGPLLIKIDYFEAAIIKGRHRTRNTYLESHSAGVTQALWKINHELRGMINQKSRINNHLLDTMLLRINASHRPIAKVTFQLRLSFRDLALCYDKVEEVDYRGRKRYCITARIISGQILLPKENQYMSVS